MSKKDYHVFRRDDGRWHVRREGARRSSSIHATQREADRRAGELARRSRGERVTHGIDGRIRSKDSFGNDPRSVRDTEH
jgi:hypothetical protein